MSWFLCFELGPERTERGYANYLPLNHFRRPPLSAFRPDRTRLGRCYPTIQSVARLTVPPEISKVEIEFPLLHVTFPGRGRWRSPLARCLYDFVECCTTVT